VLAELLGLGQDFLVTQHAVDPVATEAATSVT